jgi:hypothetical protein
MLPTVFCWSKFGVESGETPERIIERKEWERRENGGVFLWGIGNSIRPSIERLSRLADQVEVLFTPMLSKPSAQDVSPTGVVYWKEAIGIDGSSYRIPDGSVVTSKRGGRQGRVAKHFALVCQSDHDLRQSRESTWFSADGLRNLLTGSMVGSSQVTSVVRYVADRPDNEGPYRVAFRATLVYPFLLTLLSPSPSPATGGCDGSVEQVATCYIDQLAPEVERTPDRAGPSQAVPTLF